MADAIYTNFKNLVGLGSVNMSSAGDTFKCALLTATYSPEPATHTMFSDLTDEVASQPTTNGYGSRRRRRRVRQLSFCEKQ